MPMIKVSEHLWKELNAIKYSGDTFESVIWNLLHPLKGQISFKDREEINWEAIGLKVLEDKGENQDAKRNL